MLYTPRSFQESDLSTLHAFMKQHAFSTVISHGSGINVSHLPLMLVPDRGDKGTLLGHLARANPHWKDFDGERPALCVFHGPHAYISPTWYKVRPSAPTWNYAVVHALGRPRIIDTQAELSKLIDVMLAEYEPASGAPGHAAHLPEEVRAQLLEHIVGFELPIEELQGKFKLGQNRSAEDQAGMMEGLAGQGGDALALLELMRKRSRTRGPS
ncbi:FMN-binding negative transcriptional regulator [Corallococcus sp. AB011P]|uniref:FMN-binding negative transcriptional regulator n=1 Tax=unclassified Corallococcus TaxID=2685029 RepID=UPI000EA148BD|nr:MULTISPECIES: FMN-binding negative transcriptional regulator [unclassified Corallococcus]RKG59481.1 FMN-binding negative transcriptional regulator [Corallococcus sp. AB011P]RKH88801.1 FMN-binding negative transcriptional regulator [Corallococcus sp. AB045]